jgi:hypothetical protein
VPINVPAPEVAPIPVPAGQKKSAGVTFWSSNAAISRQRTPSETMKSTSLDAFASRGERRKGLGSATEHGVGR